MRDVLFRGIEVLRQPRYGLLAFFSAIGVFFLVNLLAEFRNVVSIVSNGSFDAWSQTKLISLLLLNPTIMFDGLTIVAVAVLSVLFGLNVAFNMFLLRTSGASRLSPASLLGLMTGVLGVGCAACGSFVLGSFLSASATAAVISLLPLRGKELWGAGIAVMLMATYRTLKSMGQKTCTV